MLKKIAALVMCAVITATAAGVTAGADNVQTAQVIREYNAGVESWDGKTRLQANSSYVVSDEIKITASMTIPEGAKVTVISGGRLVVDKGGSLIVDGTLNVYSGANIIIYGKMKLNSGGRITSSGDFRFGNASDITIDGVFTINNGKSSALQGAPKSIIIDDDSKLKIYGKNFCKKVAAVAEERNLASLYDNIYTAAIIDNDIYAGVELAMPIKALRDADSRFVADGSSLEAFCKDFGVQYQKDLRAQGIDTSKITDIKAEVKKLTASTDMTSERYMQLIEYYSGYTKLMDAEVEITLVGIGKRETVTSTVVMVGRNWYIL